ncbi:unnamed protein product [Fraxinus pennsylvanica]|uniref:KOW domain-containing protein n=1 Tax=Fraxinus pennsylvanica TaxID=56036 RepID=A0AAD1ZRS4_9LAMI|nr:unnamed protein product [Fraxinus pennsylvanica]
MVSAKGKEKVTDGGKGKRKWSGAGGGDNDKTGQKRKNRGVLQFFDDRAYEIGEDDDEDSSDDSMLDYAVVHGDAQFKCSYPFIHSLVPTHISMIEIIYHAIQICYRDIYGGGVPAKRTAIPAPRLISSSELEEFRPLIQYRRDRDTNLMFEILDGMLLKDGYLYKKVSIDSLSLWGVMPTDDELLKFEPSKKDESNDGQWLSQLFGEQKKKHVQAIKKDKGGGKEGGKEGGSCSSTMENNFEMHDLVFFGRKDFGVVIGTEKDNSVKVIKEGSEGPSVVTVKQRELKSASFDKKLFTVLDQHAKTISINDIVRVLDGPLKDKQGTVKKIYKGILFLCDESEQENNGYICVKAQLCEKINISGDASKEKGSEPGGPSGFEDFPSSPKSPLSPKNSWQERDTKDNSNREDNGMFSVGQLLRIRLGPLKGYLCRVLAVRRSEVTVKLDSQHKILTVKCEHLSEVRGRNSAISQGERLQDASTDWKDGTALSTDGENWNAGGLSTERTSWSAFPSSLTLDQESGPVGASNPVDDDAQKGTEGSAWEIKATPNQNPSWGAATADEKMVANAGSVGSWGTSRDDTGGSKEAWNKTGASSENETGGWGNAGGKLDLPEASAWKKDTGANAWKDAAGSNEGQNANWGNIKKDGAAGWGKGGSSSDKAVESQPEGTMENQEQSWGKASSAGQTDSWSKPKPVGADGGTSWNNQDSKPWAKQDTSSWSKKDGGSSWSKQDGGSNGNKQDDGDSLHKKDSESSWGNRGGGAWKEGAEEAWEGEMDLTGKEDFVVYDWKKGSNNNSEGWKGGSIGGSSFQGGSWSSGWNQSKGDADGAGNTQAVRGWNNSADAKIDYGQSSAGGSDWKTSNASAGDVSTGWGQPSGQRDTAGWKKESASGNQNTTGKWKSDATDGGSSKESNKVEQPKPPMAGKLKNPIKAKDHQVPGTMKRAEGGLLSKGAYAGK